MTEAPGENFILTDTEVESKSKGDISFAKRWKFKNVIIKAIDKGILKVQNSADMDI